MRLFKIERCCSKWFLYQYYTILMKSLVVIKEASVVVYFLLCVDIILRQTVASHKLYIITCSVKICRHSSPHCNPKLYSRARIRGRSTAHHSRMDSQANVLQYNIILRNVFSCSIIKLTTFLFYDLGLCLPAALFCIETLVFGKPRLKF
jgi:hypothetical protein